HQQLIEFAQRLAKAFSRVVVMMQMDLDLAEALPAQLDQGFEMFRTIFLGRIKKRVDGLTPVCITVARAQFRISPAPARDARALLLIFHPAPLRLEVIDEAEQDMDRPLAAAPALE